jgi:hypothetical protein
MLERKRTLKEIQTLRAEDGSFSRVYQFPKTGEVLVVPDPQLRLDQIAEVQLEVAELLGKPPEEAESGGGVDGVGGKGEERPAEGEAGESEGERGGAA